MATSRGMDVSVYQGPQDWPARKAAGLTFAFAKASEGMRSRDSHFAQHITGIKAAGLIPGAYHFAWPNQDPAKESANYISAVKPYAGAGFVHWLDLERRSDGANYAGRTAAQIRAYAAAWIAAVQHAFPGQRVGVYTSGDDLAKGHVPAGATLWYPAYPGTRVDTYAEAEHATRPNPSGHAVTIWQFTSNPATGPNLDLNLAYMSAADLRTWAGGAKPAPAPAPKPKPAPTYEPFPGAAWFKTGRKSPIVAAMHKRLVAVGCNRYKSSTNSDTWGSGDVASYAAWQKKLGYSGTDANGTPGATSWSKLHVPNV